MFFSSFAFADIYKCNKPSGSYLSSEPCGAGALVVESPKPVQSEHKAIGIRRGVNGVYNIRGEISGLPVVIVMDTGASRTTISGRVAKQLGINNCTKAGVTQTANGYADFCRLTLRNLKFGGFEILNPWVFMSPNMINDVLLGDDYLYAFKVEVSQDVMYLSR